MTKSEFMKKLRRRAKQLQSIGVIEETPLLRTCLKEEGQPRKIRLPDYE